MPVSIVDQQRPLARYEVQGSVVTVRPGAQSGRTHVRVDTPHRLRTHTATEASTSYPLPLIEQVLAVKGPEYLCDEIRRDEDPHYIERRLRLDLLAYLAETDFAGKSLLDFGCGSGSSTMILRRMAPGLRLYGIDLDERLLALARARGAHHGCSDVRFLCSPDSASLPAELPQVDFLLLNAVLEHMLPDERRELFPRLWAKIKPGGILFLRETPHRYSPVEAHTTGWPGLNYLPDWLAHSVVARYGQRGLRGRNWSFMLRSGIRGSSVTEVRQLLGQSAKAELLNPTRMGFNDRIDLWHATLDPSRHTQLKRAVVAGLKTFRAATGRTFVPTLSLAFRKLA